MLVVGRRGLGSWCGGGRMGMGAIVFDILDFDLGAEETRGRVLRCWF